MNQPIFDRFHTICIIPVIEIDSTQHARPLAESLLMGGLPVAEVHAVGGSWMAKRQMIADGRFDEITSMAKEASDVVKQIRRM